MDNILILKQLTKESIENKKFSFSLPKSVEGVEGYYEKYLKKSVGDISVRNVYVECKDRKGNIKKDEIKFEKAPIHNQNTLLAMAFTKANEMYEILKSRLPEVVKTELIEGKTLFTNKENEAVTIGGLVLSPLECLMMSGHLLQGKNSSLIRSIKKGERQQINEFAVILPILEIALSELRNYHSHILHEPGPIKFENIYGEAIPKNEKGTNTKLNTIQWQKAKEWFKNKMVDVKNHLINSLSRTIKEIEEELTIQKLSYRQQAVLEDELKDAQKVHNTIENYCFEKDGYVTKDALLFIACMFLRKSEANYFVNKWTGYKKTQGVYCTLHTFFTYYSIRDKKSLYSQSSPLLKFRKITGILSTMPQFKNECFVPFNQFINEKNDEYGKKIEIACNNHLKDEEAKWNAYCIPVRKSFNPTFWYLDYLTNKGYLKDYKIAIYKTIDERSNFLETNEISTISDLKIRMKSAKGDEKNRLTKIYNECKKNYLFKETKDVLDNYCIKNDNAMIQYLHNNIAIQANLSSDFLMKWVFVDLILEKNNENFIGEMIKSHLIKQYETLIKGGFENRKDINLPPSLNIKLIDKVITKTKNFTTDDALKIIENRLNELNKFDARNKSRKAPWKYEAKQKIDIILEFVHLAYTYKVYDTGKIEDKAQRRHDALSDMEYLDALDYIRFYGKNYDSPEFKQFFFNDKRTYFHSIHGSIANSKTLEELYNSVFQLFTEFYENKYIKKPHKINLQKFIKIFNPPQASKKEQFEEHAKRFATNQVLLHEMIKISERAKNAPEYQEWKKNIKDPKRTTDFSLMRHILKTRNPFDTNTDFFMKIIMPAVFENNKNNKENVLLNDKGKLKGNTSLFNTLMKNKTDELMLFEIAKKYWVDTYFMKGNKDIKKLIPNNKYQLKEKSEYDKTPYKNNLYFYELYTEELILPLGDNIEIKIKPKKYDDEFQLYKIEEIKKYIKYYQPQKSKDGYLYFEAINKEMKNIFAKYLDDLYLLLIVEKKIVQENYNSFCQKLEDKSKEPNWQGYQLIFGRQKEDKDSDNNMLAQMIYKQINPTDINYNLANLIMFRNNIMHQQVQENKKVYDNIKISLIDYCKKNNIL